MTVSHTDPLIGHKSRVLSRLADYAFDDDQLLIGPVLVKARSVDGGSFVSLGYNRLTGVAIKRGREGANQQHEPGTLTFSFRPTAAGRTAWGTDHPELPYLTELEVLKVGTPVTWEIQSLFAKYLNDSTATIDPEVYANAFTGWVTDIRLEYVRQAAGPPAPVAHVTAQGVKARAAQVRIGGAPYPAEPLYVRRNRIWGAADAVLVQGDNTSGAGEQAFGNWTPQLNADAQVMIAARDVDRTDPVALAESLAADVGAVWFESIRRDSRLMWQAMDDRSGRTPLVELSAAEVARTATWGESLAGLVNRYTVEYGPEEARAEVTVEDSASIALYGEYAASRSTELLELADAERLAAIIVGRNSRPVWTITRLEVDLLDLALEKAKARDLLLRADVGTLIALSALPATAPSGRYFFVEGSEVVLTKHDARLVLFVSDAGRTGAAMKWEEVPPALTWAAAPPSMTWLQASSWFELPPEQVRWVDVPSDVTWWQLGPGEVRPDGDGRAPSWASYPDNPTP